MKLWKKVSGALKDHRSLLKASLTLRSTLRKPDVETAVIKATSHDESRVDYRNAQCIFVWVVVSDDCLHHVLWALSHRMRRTRNWVVVLKGLVLLHGVFCCKVPGIQNIGRLPFDLLNLKDKNMKQGKTSDLNAFIHAYYAFLDEKSSFIFFHSQEQRERRVEKRIAILLRNRTDEEQKDESRIQDLIWLQKLQGLLDMLLQIQPKSNHTVNVLVLEAMDCVMIEIYDICSRICSGIANVLTGIYSAGKDEARLALSILQKAKVQHEELSRYFEFCRDIGVGNASKCPRMEEIPEGGIRELEHIINGDSEQVKIDESSKEEEKSIILIEHNILTNTHDPTVITNDWEVFDEEEKKSNQDLVLIHPFSPPPKNNATINPSMQRNMVELPDLIRF